MSEVVDLSPAARVEKEITALCARYVDEYRCLSHIERAEFKQRITSASNFTMSFFTDLDSAANSLTKSKVESINSVQVTSIEIDEDRLRQRLLELYVSERKSAEKIDTRQFCILFSLYKLKSGSGVQLDKLHSACTGFCLKIAKDSLNADVNKMVSNKTKKTNDWVTSAGKGKYKILPAGEARLKELALELGYLIEK